MTERQMKSLLMDLLEDDEVVDDYSGHKVMRVRDFQDAGLLTRNKGLVVKMVDGSEFQITIVQSRRPEGEAEEEEDDQE